MERKSLSEYWIDDARRISPNTSPRSVTQTLPRSELVSTAKTRMSYYISPGDAHGENRDPHGRRRLPGPERCHSRRRPAISQPRLRCPRHQEWLGRPDPWIYRTSDLFFRHRYPAAGRHHSRNVPHESVQANGSRSAAQIELAKVWLDLS